MECLGVFKCLSNPGACVFEPVPSSRCPLSPILFVVIMDFNASSWMNGVWFNILRIASLLFTDDVILFLIWFASDDR